MEIHTKENVQKHTAPTLPSSPAVSWPGLVLIRDTEDVPPQRTDVREHFPSASVRRRLMCFTRTLHSQDIEFLFVFKRKTAESVLRIQMYLMHVFYGTSPSALNT